MPYCGLRRKIASGRRQNVELSKSVISLREVKKNRQKGVNTRENVCPQPRVLLCARALTLAQLIVLSWSVPRSSFSLSEISQKCSQLIHTLLLAALASGLESRNQFGKRQEKNEFYFHSRRKFFLDWKNEARVCFGKNNYCFIRIFD
jgi:hypothetical protein